MKRLPKLETTAAGSDESANMLAVFGEMLTRCSEVAARKRRAAAVDETDFRQAWDQIVSNERKNLARNIVVDFLLLFAGGIIAFGINVWTGDGDSGVVAATIVSGSVLTLVLLMLKYNWLT